MDGSVDFSLLIEKIQDMHYTSNIGHIVSVIAKELSDFIKMCEEIAADHPQDIAQSVFDDKVDTIEDFLGISFVACQSYISSVVSEICRLHEACRSLNPAISLRTTTNRKFDIMKACSRNVKGTEYSEIQVIDAFANYYKHMDEWDWDWNCPPNRSRLTVQIIQSVGASRGNTGNMRTGAEALGNDDYCNARVFNKTLENWSRGLFEAYRNELRGKRLLPSA